MKDKEGGCDEVDVIIEADELRSAFESFNLKGHRIVSIATAGKDPMYDPLWTINYHNHMVIGLTGYHDPRWKHQGDTVHVWEIPDNCMQTRLLNSDQPFLLTLDDGRVLAVGMVDFGKAIAEIVPSSEVPENPSANAGLVFRDIIGEKIDSIHIRESGPDEVPAVYMDLVPKKAIKYFIVKCSEHSLHFSLTTCAILDANEDTLGMTFAEVKEASPYLLEYFDK